MKICLKHHPLWLPVWYDECCFSCDDTMLLGVYRVKYNTAEFVKIEVN